jgi:hypothetical protein
MCGDGQACGIPPIVTECSGWKSSFGDPSSGNTVTCGASCPFPTPSTPDAGEGGACVRIPAFQPDPDSGAFEANAQYVPSCMPGWTDSSRIHVTYQAGTMSDGGWVPLATAGVGVGLSISSTSDQNSPGTRDCWGVLGSSSGATWQATIDGHDCDDGGLNPNDVVSIELDFNIYFADASDIPSDPVYVYVEDVRAAP